MEAPLTDKAQAAREEAAVHAAVISQFSHLPAYFTTSARGLKRIHDLLVNKARPENKAEHAEASATLFRLKQLDDAIAKVIGEEGSLLFEGVSASGRDMLELLMRD